MTSETENGMTVVVVDEDSFLRRQIQFWLESNSAFRCIGSCADGRTGLEKISLHTPSLAIVDIALESIPGIEVILRARQRAPSMKLLVITGLPDDHLVFEAIEAGADGFLDKPFDRRAFFTALEEVLSGRYPLSPRARKLLVQKYKSFRPKPSAVSGLTKREKEVVELAFVGMADETIARKLGLSLSTVRWHEKNIHYKLKVHCRAELQMKLLGLNGH